MISRPTLICQNCNVIHGLGRTCPVQSRADQAEAISMVVAASTFARWASSYLASIGALAHAGVQVGRDT